MSAGANFSPGDTVQLKSGGPKMTVVAIAQNGKVQCYFFSGDELKIIYLEPVTITATR